MDKSARGALGAPFPDGQLYVNLQGFAPGGAPKPGADAVRGFLNALFESTPERTGAWNYRWPEAEVRVVSEAVAAIPYWTSDGVSWERGFLSLDTTRWSDADEAWLPVSTPDGPGTLLWCNSD
jgi:hypothetical protein